MTENLDLDKKFDAFFQKMDQRLTEMENKLENRISKVEEKFVKIEENRKKQKKINKNTIEVISYLTTSVGILEQDKLENNIIVKGVPELEGNDTTVLNGMVTQLFSHLDKSFQDIHINDVRRIGNKADNRSRLILVKICSSNRKLNLMKGLAAKNVNCSIFKNGDVAWGSSDSKIYLSDHLTTKMSQIYYQARQLKKQNVVKYAWTKLGKIYVKQDDDSRAYNVCTSQQLLDLKDKFTGKDGAKTDFGEADSECSDEETEMDTESEASSKRKRSPTPKPDKRKIAIAERKSTRTKKTKNH